MLILCEMLKMTLFFDSSNSNGKSTPQTENQISRYQPNIHHIMKAKILTIALTASAFAFVACKPKAVTTEEVSAGADKVAEGVSEIVEAAVEEVEPAPAEPAPAESAPAPTEPAPE